ncbi:uncharacterized protein LOC142341410 [Convolutriloba macropyga]|uniref:uncharacterized protein LOC142341410 n=1 Tax=Convolutriloba macropyga TaxID=536237 RepID=UPI003F5215B3
MQQFYMDDFMQTYSSEGEARRSAEEIKTVLHTGGFNLTKFLINKPAALENLMEEDKAEMKAQRILGQPWNPKTDKLMFAKPKFLYTGQQMTQRKVLSIAASLFDPDGLISPFAIRIRCILQRIIKEGRNWYQPVSECYLQELQEWMDELDSMTPIQIPRCLIPNTNETHQLHTFTDASMSGIAAIVYVRTTNADGSCISQYVISKTKVAPIKQLSVPKLELEAATLGAEQDENGARNYLIKTSQNEFVSGTISTLLKGSNREKGDNLMPFTPFLDDIGLLRVGGRLNKAPLTYSAKHPLVLHIRSRIARLLIEKAHHDCGYQGLEHVKAHLQQTFLMIGLRKALRSLGKYCFICGRWRADNVRPKMADLPEFRFPVVNKQYPFVNTGMDMFGPFYIEDRREGTQMQYVCLFKCLVTRAVH